MKEDFDQMKTLNFVRCVVTLLLAPLAAQAGQVLSAVPPSPARIEVIGAEAPRLRMFSTDKTLARSFILFSDREYKAPAKLPAVLYGKFYYELSIAAAHRYAVREAGELWALAPVNAKVNRTTALERLGFQRVAGVEPFQLFGENPADVVGVFHKRATTGETIDPPVWTLLLGFAVDRVPPGGELLYNGIRLPREWPPRIDWSTDAPMPVPYLEQPPKRIPIDVGRQLFVDDFLIAASDLVREFHLPQKYAGNPVLRPETEIEKKGLNNLAVAGPKSGGLWWNPEKELFELWYEAGWVTTIAYATSRDGVHWDRPDLPLRPGTNQVLPPEVKPDSWTVVRDYRTTDPRQAFKIFLRGGGARDRARYFVSAEGLDWGRHREGGVTGDRSTMFYNAFRSKWVFSLRWDSPGGRSRAYWEADDFEQGMQWLPDEPVPWARADRLDLPDPRIGDRTQLYNLDAVPYESILLGCYEIFHGPSNDVNAAKGLPKNTSLNFGYSRDGFHWHRPDRRMAISSEQRAVWDRGYVQSLGNLCTVRGDKLWFYYIGYAGDPAVKLGDPGVKSSMHSGLYANAATGIAFLRRDGFASLNADHKGGSMTTRPLTFSGRHLFVNLDAPHGSLRAEVIDMNGAVVPPFSLENCRPLTGDSTLAQLRWQGGDDLTRLANRTVRFRFRLENGKFYAFWVSRDATGRSDGYIAGGGPGFTSDLDTVGRAALEAEARMRIP
jgi:hypothetical protein